MERIIHNMMEGFQVGEERLQAEKQISLPIGQILDWDYYCYVRKNPICFDWKIPTAILYDSDDNLSECKGCAKWQLNTNQLFLGEEHSKNM